jgi:hypothetical protein
MHLLSIYRKYLGGGGVNNELYYICDVFFFIFSILVWLYSNIVST